MNAGVCLDSGGKAGCGSRLLLGTGLGTHALNLLCWGNGAAFLKEEMESQPVSPVRASPRGELLLCLIELLPTLFFRDMAVTGPYGEDF